MMKKLKAFCLMLLLLLCVSSIALGETFTFSLVGDCTVGDQWIYHGYGSSFTYKISQAGLDYPFSLVADLFAADDLTIANCEGVLTDRQPGSNAKFMTLGAETKFGEVFKLGNVDVCNIANNHAKDFGEKGRQDTIDTLTALGIGVFGDDELYETEIKGVKIGIVGYTYPINESKMKRYAASIQQLKDDGCTFIIASAHWGKEESYNINLDQRTYGPELIDLGADMVYGHGSHTLQPIQIYNGKVIFYSLANFTFGANSSPKDDDTAVMQVTYTINDDGTMDLQKLTALPFKMCKDRDFRPYPIEDEEGKLQVWKKLVFYKSKDPDSGLPESFLTTGVAVFQEIEEEATPTDLTEATPTDVAEATLTDLPEATVSDLNLSVAETSEGE